MLALADRIAADPAAWWPLVAAACTTVAPAGFDSRPTWDNQGQRFDNRPTWDNWSK
ncbi:multiple cyclophane-containing RiPP AmcA [Embleya sp. NPDC059237]|uniref:multiple cyclophane-containing RiPP AmcA n=1 Tax=Embleya sp. NPDC059237 TaxID=3346784 RepID=UPI00368C5A76